MPIQEFIRQSQNIYQFFNFIQEAIMTQAIPMYSHSKDEHFLVKINKDFKCICELCNCGKHKCPRQQVKGEFDTSYGNHYKNFSIVPQIIKPKYHYEQRHYNPQSMRTNYQETYFEKEQVPTMSASRLENVGRQILKSGPFVSNTSYTDEYKPFRIEPQIEPIVDDSPSKDYQLRTRENIRFEGESAYKSAFHSLPIPKIERYKHPEYKNIAPFTGSSSYKSQFANFKIQPSMEGPSPYKGSKPVKFEGSSTYNSHFKGFQIQNSPNIPTECHLDNLIIPPSNYINSNQHIYYNHNSKQFI